MSAPQSETTVAYSMKDKGSHSRLRLYSGNDAGETYFATISRVSRAITSSSFVGTTITLMGESAVEITAS